MGIACLFQGRVLFVQLGVVLFERLHFLQVIGVEILEIAKFDEVVPR